jgi:hypothetical protein
LLSSVIPFFPAFAMSLANCTTISDVISHCIPTIDKK